MKNRKYKIEVWSSGLFLILLSGCGMNNWKIEETPNLSIYYKSGSYAEKNLATAKRVYENSFQLAEQFLPKINKWPKVKIYLYDKLKNKGYSKVTEREVHYRYSEEFRLTSMHEFLHIFLHELNPNAPLRLEEGVCRLKEGKRKKFKGQFYQIMYYQLVKFVPKERWTVEEIFQDHYKNDDEGNIAAAFIVFALQKLKESQFWSFYQQLSKDNWKVMLKQYFKKDIAVIDQEFMAFVHTITDPPEAFKHKYSPKTAHLHK